MCNLFLIEYSYCCLCAIHLLLMFCLAYVCIRQNYQEIPLLMCSSSIIKYFCCLYAKVVLSTSFIAYVQESSYWYRLLLMCNRTIIEYSPCLCAEKILLKRFVAYVQRDSYWFYLLLMCRYFLIDDATCFCASTNLFIRFFAYMYTF